MFRRVVIFFIIITLVLSFGGCWSRREIEQLAISALVTYDKVTVNGQDKWMLSESIFKPGALSGQGPLGGGDGGGGGGGGGQPRLVVSSLGDTIWEAWLNTLTRIPRRGYLAHADIIIIGEQVAREGVKEIFDNLLRSKDLRINTWIMVTKGQAIDVLKTEPELEQLLSQEIMGLVETTQPSVSKAFTIDVKNFVNKLITPGQDAVASHIELFERGGETSAEGEDGSSLSGSGSKSLRLRGASVFRKDKLVGWLDDRETQGYLYVMGKAKQGIVSLSVHEHDKKDVAFLMTRTKTKIIPSIEDDQITFTIDIKTEGDLAEHEDTSPIANPENIKLIEAAASEKIKKMVEELIKKAKNQFEADIFGFGDRLHKKYPQIWREIEKDWREIYPDVEVTVNVEAEVRRIGLITNTPVIN